VKQVIGESIVEFASRWLWLFYKPDHMSWQWYDYLTYFIGDAAMSIGCYVCNESR